MTTVERRQAARTNLEKLAYIHIEPNNGAIVLNVSGEGLCFHSMAPVARNETFRFSVGDHNRRIEASGELLWTDEMQKVGGLRFKDLSSAARGQIRDWIAETRAPQEETKTAKLKYAVLNRFQRGLRRFRKSDPLTRSGLFSRTVKVTVPARLSGFSSGLVTGLLVSAVLAAIFISSNAYRLQFGQSLIHLGEHLVATADVKDAASAFPRKVPSVLARNESEPAAPPSPAPSLEVAKQPAAPALPPAAKPRHAKGEAVRTIASVAARGPSPASVPLRPSAESEKLQAPPPPFALVADAVSPDSILPARAVIVPVKLAGPQPIRGDESGSLLAMYLDIGRFKDELRAQNLKERVAQLGLRSTVTRKGHLWANSYQVLVGPYVSEEEETTIEGELRSNGYKPRPFERGSRDFEFASPLVVKASKLPIGDLSVSWESYVRDARVKFLQGGNVMTTVDATWIKRPYTYLRNEYVYIRQGDGSRTLVELHFSGLSRALTFAN